MASNIGFRMGTWLFVAITAIVATACSGGSKGSPTSPTPAPVAVVPPTLTFASDAPAAPAAFSYSLESEPGAPAGQIQVAIKANSMARFTMFRGTLIFDSTVLSVVSFGEGDFMKQGGALATFSVTGAGTNRATIRIDRPDSLAGAVGSGTILTLRFQPVTGVRSGRSALQWDDPHAYTASFSETLSRTYGGSVTIQ